jgi:hypothetical protein
MFSNQDRLANATAAVLRRWSSPGQGDRSKENQERMVEEVIKRHSVKVVLDIQLEGVSGSIPGNRNDIDDIVAHKRLHNDFTYLICPSPDRFTRAGSGHGQHLLYELECAGIVVYFVAENLFSDDRMAKIFLGYLFEAARQYSESLARNSVLGNTTSFLGGRSPYAHRPPFGLDRKYVDGKDMHILRNLADGTQEMLHAVTGDVIRTFGRNPKNGTPEHYQKQKSEMISLVPGDPKAVAIVWLIMEMRWTQHVKGHDITRYLNDHNLWSPTGIEWSAICVRYIYQRPIYVGLGVRDKTRQGIYVIPTFGTPEPAKVSAQELATRKRPLKIRRPRNEWKEREVPNLYFFLPEHVRDLADRGIKEHLSRQASGKPLKARSYDYSKSEWFLVGLLRTKNGGHRMSGARSRKLSGGFYRYYAVSRHSNNPKSGDGLKGMVPADPLENMVVKLLRETLLQEKSLLQRITAANERVLASTARTVDAEEVEAQLLAARAKQLAMIERLTGDAIKDQKTRYRLDELDHLVSALEAQKVPLKPVSGKRLTPRKSVAELVASISSMFDKLTPADNQHLRMILRLFVSRLTVDQKTREAEIELVIPDWMVQRVTGGSGFCTADHIKADMHRRAKSAADLTVLKATAHFDREKWEFVPTIQPLAL